MVDGPLIFGYHVERMVAQPQSISPSLLDSVLTSLFGVVKILSPLVLPTKTSSETSRTHMPNVWTRVSSSVLSLWRPIVVASPQVLGGHIARASAAKEGEEAEVQAAGLLRRISISIHRENARAVLRRLTSQPCVLAAADPRAWADTSL